MIAFGWKDILGLKDILGIPINPATEDKQDEIIAAINGITGGGASALGNGSTNVVTPGTPVQLSESSVPTRRVHIRAKAANTNYIYVGGSDVSSTSGVFLGPQDSLTLNISDLSAVYIDAAIGGEGAQYTYEE